MENFITEIIDKDLADGKITEVVTRFPPEPNGFLHLGHAKSMHLNFGIAEKHRGKCNLRFDNTNSNNTTLDYINAIGDDVKWLGYKPDHINFVLDFEAIRPSNYSETLIKCAEKLIEKDLAYVCFLTPEEISENRGDPNNPAKPGVESPSRDSSVLSNSVLFEKMLRGDYKDGEAVLRAKINMASPNVHMRDPVIYRIKNGEASPMYDFAHCISDAVEGITHSLCTLEFEVHRPLYDWILEHVDMKGPKQIEFARLNVDYTVLSKRKLKELVEGGHVEGWDDPRMPTIAGLRRRGYTPEAIKVFMEKIGISKRENIIEIGLLEHCLRDDLNKNALRRFAVLDPLKLVITNFDEVLVDRVPAVNNPEDENAGTRELTFSKELWIEKDDFLEEANSKYKRMVPGRYTRLKYGYIVLCTGCKKDDDGNIVEVYAEYVPESRSGNDTSGIKPKGAIHWVSARDCVDGHVILYDRLFKEKDPNSLEDFKDGLNENSKEVIVDCKFEASLEEAELGVSYQFERLGYFCVEPSGNHPTFNRTIELKSNWK